MDKITPHKLSKEEVRAFEEMCAVDDVGTSGHVDKDYNLIKEYSSKHAVTDCKNKMNVIEDVHWGKAKRYEWSLNSAHNLGFGSTCFDRPVPEDGDKPRFFGCFIETAGGSKLIGMEEGKWQFEPSDPFDTNRTTAISELWLADINKDGLFDIVIKNGADHYAFFIFENNAEPTKEQKGK